MNALCDSVTVTPRDKKSTEELRMSLDVNLYQMRRCAEG